MKTLQKLNFYIYNNRAPRSDSRLLEIFHKHSETIQTILLTCMRVYKTKIEAHTGIKDVAIMRHTQVNYKGSREINEVY